MLNFRKKIFKNLLRSHKGNEAETLHKCLCYYPLHKLCFFIAVAMRFRCYGTFKFPRIYNGNSGSRPLFLSDFRYFEKKLYSNVP